MCPLLYRFRVIDKLPETPSIDAVRGSVVHKVLEYLFDLPAADRTHDRANLLLPDIWEQLLEAEPELAQMFAEAAPTGPRRPAPTWPPGSTSAARCSAATSRWRTRSGSSPPSARSTSRPSSSPA